MPVTKFEKNIRAKAEAKLQGQSETLEQHQKLKTYSIKLPKSDLTRLQKLADKSDSTLGYQIEQALTELFQECSGLEMPEEKPRESWYSKTTEQPLVKSKVNGGKGTIKVVSTINRKFLPLPELLGEIRIDSPIHEMELETAVVSLQPRYMSTLCNHPLRLSTIREISFCYRYSDEVISVVSEEKSELKCLSTKIM